MKNCDELKKRVLRKVDELKNEIIEISRYINANPELGYEEDKSVAFLLRHLEKHNLTIEFPISGIKNAFRAHVIGKKLRPAIGFISEYDALPEMGHGCGHNLIGASGFGVVASLAPFMNELDGSIYLFGTPAEECDGGKIPMIEQGLFSCIDATMMMHPECMYLANTICLALDALKVKFYGKSSHASSTPHEGINALDAMVTLFNSVGLLRQQVKIDARISGIITKGGTYPNIIPDYSEALFYIRATSRKYLNEVTAKFKKCVEGSAIATGCKFEIDTFERSMDEMVNNPVLGSLIEKNLKAVGVEEILKTDEFPGSTDYGNVSQVVPSLYFYAATAPKGSELHTPEFTALSITDHAHDALIISIKAMVLSAIDLFCDEKLMERVSAGCHFEGA